MNNPFMRIIVFFDLPVKTKYQRQKATRFRNDLLKEGYYMVQFSVYARLCNSIENSEVHKTRLQKFVPETGSIRVMTVTEKQYASMQIIAGEKKEVEKSVKAYQLSIF